MGRFLLKWVVLTVSLLVAAWVGGNLGLPIAAPVRDVPSFLTLMLGAGVLALLNTTLGRVLKLLIAPLNCLTLGLFSVLINAGLFYLAGTLNLGFSVKNFWAALVGSILMGLINGVLSLVVPDDDRE